MFLQTVLTTRRRFLERSALGAGSLLVAPGLLASCTDHRIPDPPQVPIHPTFTEDIDWNEDAKIAVTAGLAMIPEVGEILSALVDIFWPTDQKASIWDKIKEQVEALVNQKISDLVYQQVSEDLQGLNNSTTLYLDEVKNGGSASKLTQWIVTRNSFAQALPHFQSKGYEVLLLPLFAQFANLYLSILRDAVVSGKSWGRNDDEHKDDIKYLQDAITEFTNYATNTYDTGLTNIKNSISIDHDRSLDPFYYIYFGEPFKSVNKYDRHMTLNVLDYMSTWEYYDAIKYPNGNKVQIRHEIYTDPIGFTELSGDIVINKPIPAAWPTRIDVWGSNYVDAVQVTYPSGSNPGGDTERMGGTGVVNVQPNGLTRFILPAQITAVRVNTDANDGIFYGPYTKAYLKTAGIRGLGLWGGPGQTYFAGMGFTSDLYNTPGWTGWMGFPLHSLSRIHINGITNGMTGNAKNADSIVFGFMPSDNSAKPVKAWHAVHTMYVRSPTERSIADFAKAFPDVTLTATLITDELKAARKAYWESIQARAKALK
jgi:hypothetical protein